MPAHNLFYYPYASFTSKQLPLLKVAALYFDKLVILDPVGASWVQIGADHHARDAVKLLVDADILELVTPSKILVEYGSSITDAIRRDMQDPEFLDLCQARGGGRWTLSMAKVPTDLLAEQTMRSLMGDFAREVARDAGRYREHASEFRDFAEQGETYDEYREGYGDGVEYRNADFPLALGEAIMINHALFAALCHTHSTPITDDPFHSNALSIKLRRATQEPVVKQVQTDRARDRQLKADLLAARFLSDSELKLPVLSPELHLEEILEYRREHHAALQQVREKLALMARRIEAEPWTDAFAKELYHRTIPDVADELDQVRRARDTWLASQRGRFALKAAGVALGAATVALSLFTAPLTPVALATAGLGLASSTAIPGAEWLLDWRSGRKNVEENGLHYLLCEPRAER